MQPANRRAILGLSSSSFLRVPLFFEDCAERRLLIFSWVAWQCDVMLLLLYVVAVDIIFEEQSWNGRYVVHKWKEIIGANGSGFVSLFLAATAQIITSC
jgi:hypothetical protein